MQRGIDKAHHSLESDTAQLDSPLMSVVMACYNQEKFVAEAIDGVLGQTYEKVDLIIIDDCSTDSTADIIRAKLAAQKRGRPARFYSSHSNIGARGTFIRGLEFSEGRFVTLACCDDIMLPDMIAEMAKVWMMKGVSLISTNAIFIDEKSRSMDRMYRDPAGPNDTTFETLARDGANACCIGATMGFERRIFEMFGWPPEYLSAADIMLPFYAYLLNGAEFISTPLVKYRIHSNNSSRSARAERLSGVELLELEEKVYRGHIAHAVFMQDELDRLQAENPSRYVSIALRIVPLLQTQMAEMAKKMIRTQLAQGVVF
jgi:glycosyltransferase involved in cell wall biosynthesis